MKQTNVITVKLDAIDRLLTGRVLEGIWNMAEKKDVKEWETQERKESMR
jgi:hypothetical protein